MANIKYKKPIVLLDCDGVLADFTAATVRDWKNLTDHKIPPPKITNFDILPCLTDNYLAYRQLSDMRNKPGWCMAIPPYEDAASPVQFLNKHTELHIVTTPLDTSKHWVPERKAWLEKHFGIQSHQITFTHNKHHFRGHFFVDDKPENVYKWSYHNPDGTGILWGCSYNESEGWEDRIESWPSLLKAIFPGKK